ncbi:hypothetical protein ACTFIW_009669 [Dictyostelium discoideum]
MKLISLLNFVLLLLILTTIITKTKAIESPIFVNFIPFKNGFNCQSKVNGLGYSMALDTCISFDGYTTSWEFSWNQNTGSITGTKYKGVCKASNRNSTSPYRYANMGCDKGGDIIFNPTRLPTQVYDYKVQISTSPIYPAKSLYLVTQRLDSCSGTVIAYEFLTNETVAIAPGKVAYTYYCLPNGLPEMMDDSNGIILKGDSCDMFRPFINGSSESSYSGTSGENLIDKSKGKNKGNIYNNNNKMGGGGGGFGNAPLINFNDLILYGSGSGDTASGVTTAQPTTANPTSADSSGADSTGTYTGDNPDGGSSTGGSTGNDSGSPTGTSTGNPDDGGSSTGASSNGGTSGDFSGGTTQSSTSGDTGGNNSGASSTTSRTSGSSETHEIFLTNTCSSAQ